MTSNALPVHPQIVIPATPAVQVADVNDKYTLDQKQMGTGAFSTVVVGFTKPEGLPRAIKIMDRAQLVGKKSEMVAHEKEILRRTQHPNIIYLHECLTTPDRVYMVMDLMQGDLFEYIVSRKKLSEAESATIIKQLLSAVAYLHSISVIHRDIKPENILIRDHGEGKVEVKLADFGLAKVLENWNVLSTPCGTSFYIAPEIIRGIEANGARPMCTNREEVKFVDIWSCGVVLFVMLAGRPPFYGQVKTREERRALLAKIDKGLLFPEAQWNSISEEAKDLCQRLLTQDALHRITAQDALSHPFLKHAIDVENTGTGGAADKTAVAADDETSKLAAEMNDLALDIRETGDDSGDKSSYKVEEIKAQGATPKPKMSAFPGAKKSTAAA